MNKNKSNKDKLDKLDKLDKRSNKREKSIHKNYSKNWKTLKNHNGQ